MKNFIVASAVVSALVLSACGEKKTDVPQEAPQEMPALPTVDSVAIKDSLAKVAVAAKATADSIAAAAEEAAKKAGTASKKAVAKAKEAVKTVLEAPKKEGEAVGGTIRKAANNSGFKTSM